MAGADELSVGMTLSARAEKCASSFAELTIEFVESCLLGEVSKGVADSDLEQLRQDNAGDAEAVVVCFAGELSDESFRATQLPSKNGITRSLWQLRSLPAHQGWIRRAFGQR